MKIINSLLDQLPGQGIDYGNLVMPGRNRSSLRNQMVQITKDTGIVIVQKPGADGTVTMGGKKRKVAGLNE